MIQPNDYKSYFANSKQEILLKSLIVSGSKSFEYLNSWYQDINSINEIDYASTRLLPLLYKKILLEDKWKDLATKLKPIYHNSWSSNQILFYKASRVIKKIRDSGIPVIGFKGISLAINYYKDVGVRPMDDIDIIILPKNLPAVNKLLIEDGWYSAGKNHRVRDKLFVQAIPTNSYINKDGHNIDLHWHGLTSPYSPQLVDDLFVGNSEISVSGVDFNSLNSAAELLITCVHGMRWNKMSSIRWIADAAIIISNSIDLNWDKFVYLAQKIEVSKIINSAFTYLEDCYEVSIPNEILNILSHQQVSKIEKKEFEFIQIQPKWTSDLPQLWLNYMRINNSIRNFSFLKYLQYWWNLTYWFEIPIYIFVMGFKRVKNFIHFR